MLVTQEVTEVIKKFSMSKSNSRISTDKYTLAKYHSGKRPHLDFWVWNENTGKKERKQKFCPSNIIDDRAKRIWAKENKAIIDSLLKEGYVIAKEEIKSSEPNSIENLLLIDAVKYGAKLKIAATKEPKTQSGYRSECNVFFEFLEFEEKTEMYLSAFTQKHVYLYLDYLLLERELSNTTVNNHKSTLRAIFEALVKREIIKKNPCSEIPALPEDVGGNIAFPDTKRDVLLEYIEKKDKQLYLFIRIIYYTYMRPKEIRLLQVKHIDFINRKIYVPEENSKNNKGQYVTIPTALLNLFFERKVNELKDDDFVFQKNKKLLPINEMYNRHRNVLFKHNLLGEHTMYSWKHTGVCSAYRAGIDIKSLQRQLRHSSVAQTEVYLKSLGLEENKAFFDFV